MSPGARRSPGNQDVVSSVDRLTFPRCEEEVHGDPPQGQNLHGLSEYRFLRIWSRKVTVQRTTRTWLLPQKISDDHSWGSLQENSELGYGVITRLSTPLRGPQLLMKPRAV